MDDQNFDKIFSEQLKETQEFDFREEDWDDLSGRLKQKDRRRLAGWWWWGIAAVLAGAVIGFMGYALYTTKLEMKQLEQTVLQLEEKNQTIYQQNNGKSNTGGTALANDQSTNTRDQQTTVVHDTIYQTITKTIIEEKIIYRTAKNAIEKAFENNANLATENNRVPLISNEFVRRNSDGEIIFSNKTTTTTTTETASQNGTVLKNINTLPLLPLASAMALELPEQNTPLADEVIEDKVVKNELKKSRWQVGAESSAALATSGDYSGSRHTSLGMTANYRLNNKWKLNAGYEHYWLRYQSSTQNLDAVTVSPLEFSPERYVEVGDFSSTDQSSDGLYVQRNQGSHQLRLGVQYQLPGQFYLGTNIIGNFLGKQQSVYSRKEVDNSYVLEPANATASFNNKGFEVKRLEGSLGRYFKIGKKIEVPVELYYQQNLKKAGVIIPSLAGLRVGVNYSF